MAHVRPAKFAGLLRGKKVELVDCKTVPLKVPATAEIVLEGHVSLTEYGDEGPYGDHTGYYNSVEPFPVFTVSAITMRRMMLRIILFLPVCALFIVLIFLAEGRTRYPEIITGVVGLHQTPDAFVRLQTDKSQIKILVAPGR